MSLACSHNVNGMLAAYLADSFGISRNQKWSINYRDKGANGDIPNAANFNTAFFDENGNLLCRQNRFKSQWTDLWRNYAFSMNCCNSCSDFWGADSDVSVKDAWYKWNTDIESKSIVLIRNSKIQAIFDSIEIHKEELDEELIKKCQKSTVDYKQGAAKKRQKVPIDKWNEIDSDHRFHARISMISKEAYKKMMENEYNDSFQKKLSKMLFFRKNNPYGLTLRSIRKIKKIIRKD